MTNVTAHATILLSLAVIASAQDTKPPARLDARAKLVMDQLGAAYRGLNALHERITAQARGPEVMLGRMPETVELKVRKPNRLWMSMTERLPDGRKIKSMVVCDGITLWHWTDETNTYRKSRAPATLKAIPDGPHESPGQNWSTSSSRGWRRLRWRAR